MRRILRKIAADEHSALGDISTLADPAVVDDLVGNRLNRGPNRRAPSVERLAELASGDDEQSEVDGGARAQLAGEGVGGGKLGCPRAGPAGERVGRRCVLARQHARGDVRLQGQQIVDRRLDRELLPLGFGRSRRAAARISSSANRTPIA